MEKYWEQVEKVGRINHLDDDAMLVLGSVFGKMHAEIRRLAKSEEVTKYDVASINQNAILTQVLDKLITQTNKGIEKYGETVNPDSYETIEWIDHAIEESIDHIVYLTVLKQKMIENVR